MRLLLDREVLLWTLAGSARIKPISDLILTPETGIFVSTVSLREIATKASIGKLAATAFIELPVVCDFAPPSVTSPRPV